MENNNIMKDNKISDNKIKEMTHRIKIPAKECHYEEYILAGTSVAQYAVDCASDLMVHRDGQGGLLAAVNTSFRKTVYACDIIEINTFITKIGNRSRTVGFSIKKMVERGFDNGELKNEVLDPPYVVAEGELVLVLE